MTRSLLTILVTLLLCQYCTNAIDKPVVKPFPKDKDSFGRPVWYNTTEGKCEDIEGFYVDCPTGLIVEKPE